MLVYRQAKAQGDKQTGDWKGNREEDQRETPDVYSTIELEQILEDASIWESNGEGKSTVNTWPAGPVTSRHTQ